MDTKFWPRNLTERGHVKDARECGRIILKCILKQKGAVKCINCVWLSTRTSFWLLRMKSWNSGFPEVSEFLNDLFRRSRILCVADHLTLHGVSEEHSAFTWRWRRHVHSKRPDVLNYNLPPTGRPGSSISMLLNPQISHISIPLQFCTLFCILWCNGFVLHCAVAKFYLA